MSRLSQTTPEIDENIGIKQLAFTISSLSEAITDMRKTIQQLIEENKNLKTEIESLKSEKQQTNNLNEISINESAVEEALDRLRRANNVIEGVEYNQSDCCASSVNVLHQFSINEMDILKASRKLKSKNTMGPDNIPAFLVKQNINSLLSPLCYASV